MRGEWEKGKENFRTQTEYMYSALSGRLSSQPRAEEKELAEWAQPALKY